jgi:hypothetical protein
VQDDFKATSKLTINLGWRWDFESGVTERYDRLTGIDPLAKNPLADRTGMDLRGVALFAGSTLGRRAIRPTVGSQWNPRAGVAYQLNPNTVIRSGYGIFFGLPSYAASSGYTGAAFSSSTTWISTVGGDGITPNPAAPWSNPFPLGFNFYPGSAAGPNAALGRGLGGGWEPTLRPVYNQNWNLSIQRTLLSNMVVEVAYAGNKGTRLSQTFQMDQLHPSYLGLGNQLLQQVPNPFYGVIVPALGLGQPTIQYGHLLTPYPHYDGVSATNAGFANSNYHALLLRVEKRFSMGLSFLTSYTWSKTISDAADGLWNRADGIRDNYCRACERAVSSYDQPQRFIANVTYELPFGKGKALGGNWNGITNAAFGGWQVNGILTMSKGLPLYNFAVAVNNCFCFGGGQRPDWTGVKPVVENQNIDRWFDTAQFRQPAQFTYGTLGRTMTAVRQDGATQLDFSVFKSFQPVERMRVEFRAEAFNFTNTPLFGSPGTTLGTPTFGVVTGQENTPRQVQLALKILF